MRNKFSVIAASILAICATPSMVSCGGSTTSSGSDYYDPEHRPFGRYDEPITIKGVMEYLDAIAEKPDEFAESSDDDDFGEIDEDFAEKPELSEE